MEGNILPEEENDELDELDSELEKSASNKYLDDPIYAYFKDISRYPLLTPEEEKSVTSDMVSYRDAYLRELFASRYFLDFLEGWNFKLGREAARERDYVLRINPRQTRDLILWNRNVESKEVEDYFRESITRSNLRRVERVASYVARILCCERTGVADFRSSVYNTCYNRFFEDLKNRLVKSGVLRGDNDYSSNGNFVLPRISGKKRYELEAELLTTLPQLEKSVRIMTDNFLPFVENKKRLTSSNVRLVVPVAKSYRNRGIDFIDLISEGNVGLEIAVDVFEPALGYKFSTYATWWIRQAISRMFPKNITIPMPVYIYELRHKVWEFKRKFRAEHERKPTVREISERLGLPVKNVERLERSSMRIASLDKIVEGIDEDGDSWLNCLAYDGGESVEDRIYQDEIRKIFEEKIFPGLRERDREVMKMRFGIGYNQEHTLDETGKIFKVTRERVRQIQQRELKRMGSLFSVLGIKEFSMPSKVRRNYRCNVVRKPFQ